MNVKKMAKYSRAEVLELYDNQLNEAITNLKELKINCEDEKCNVDRVLSGWIFEHVVRHCLTEELKGLNPEMSEQFTFDYGVSESGKKKSAIIDLAVNKKILAEIKVNGHQYSNWNDMRIDEKYANIKKKANEEGIEYLYISKKEAPKPKRENAHDYRERTRKLIGEENTFFLDEEGSWERFVKRVKDLLNSKNE